MHTNAYENDTEHRRRPFAQGCQAHRSEREDFPGAARSRGFDFSRKRAPVSGSWRHGEESQADQAQTGGRGSMILADTSVWIDHLRKGNKKLTALLSEGQVSCHPFIVGELACGNLENRDEILSMLAALPGATVADHEEIIHFISRHKLHGKGIGLIDAHLLASALISGFALWTLDRSLASVAKALKIGV